LRLHNKNILLISTEQWDHIFVSKHHYATHLAKRGNKVFFLNPPSKQTQVNKTEYDNVFSVHYDGFIKGLRFLPRFLQKYFINRKFSQLQQFFKIKFDIVWSFDNSVFFDFSALPKEVYSISHIVDLTQDFEFEKAAKTADLCLGVSQPIVEKQKQFNNNSFFINHGYNQSSSPFNKKVILPGKQRIKAFYAGNLNIKYLDWELIQSCVERLPQVDFIFAGPWNDGALKTDLIVKNNFNYIGVLPAKKLGSYYQQSDILLITYKVREYPDQLSNSHKMMEYLGSGKMVVATWTNEYENLVRKELIKMAKSPNEFINSLKEVFSSIDKWNSEQKKLVRAEYAERHAYGKQIMKIERLI
jgi:hypothetical protein